MDPDQWDSLTPEQQDAVLSGPALDPPPGVDPGRHSPPNHNALVLGVTTTLLVLTTACALVRTYSKLAIDRKVNLGDVLALLGYGSYIASVWTVFHSLTFGSFFVHQWDVSVRNFLSALYGFNLLPLFYSLTLLFIKSAILLEWLSVFVPFGTRNLFFWACWALIVVNGIFYIAATFVIGFTCRPIEKYWMPMVHGHCFDRRAFDFASSIINFILDLTMIAIPQRIIWALNMRVKRKVGLSVLFSIGILTCASALGRVITGHILLDSTDRTYYLAVPALLAIAEMTGGYLVFCVPVVPKVLNQSIPFEKFLYSFKSWVRIQPQNASSETNVTTWAPNKTSNSDSREENQWENSQPNAQGILLTTQPTTGDDVTSRASQGWSGQRNNIQHYHGDR